MSPQPSDQLAERSRLSMTALLPHFHHMLCYKSKVDSIAASLFVLNWLSWQIVSDDKIQITILILRRGALSTSVGQCTFGISWMWTTILFWIWKKKSNEFVLRHICCIACRTFGHHICYHFRDDVEVQCFPAIISSLQVVVCLFILTTSMTMKVANSR